MKDIIFPITYKSDEKGLKVAESQLSGFGTIAAGAFARIGAAATEAFARATRAVADFTVDSVKAASSFTETTAAVGEVFGDGAKQLEDFAKTAAGTMGQSRTQFLQAAKTFGIFGKAAGLAGQENADFSTTLTGLASDLASFNDTSIDESITAIGAALRGESEPIRRFGVLLDDATLKARAMEMGIYDGTGSLSQQQRVLAAYQEILAQTTTQQGDFARTADGVANASRTFQGTLDNLQVTIGEALLPAIQDALPQLTAFIDSMVASPEFNQFISEVGANFSELLNYLPTALENMMSFGYDILPAIQEFLPLVNESLGFFVDFLFGVENSKAGDSTRSFADAMDDLAKSFQNVTSFMRDMRSAWDNLPEPLKWVIGQLVNNLNPFSKLQPAIDWMSSKSSPASAPTYRSGGLKLAAGGIIPAMPGGTPATIGEAGPEAVIPLDRLDRMMGRNGGGNIVINITAGMGADGAALGEQIVTAIRKYERTSGAVFAKA